ncbi:MAG TPA: 8-amino-7-oxononanoate synthase [Chitinophagaceae bacterium]|nr:8-amino-7-oxononanoate synthase [Chitinophagaceae bacterium]
MKEEFLYKKLEERKVQQSFRELKLVHGMIDFCSNDYLGIATNRLISIDAKLSHGSTGSRLLSGNYPLAEQAEALIASFHEAEAALIFNSGYDANVGLLSCVPQRGDTILYDQLCHASIRDGIRLSNAQSFSFRHNDLNELESKLKAAAGNVFVVTETVFSMDGDIPDLPVMVALCGQYGAHLILDEAHATGVIGKKGEGVMQHLQLHNRCFARVHTYGKAAGVHGAAVVGSKMLRDYLINFSRPFIFTTALPEASVAAITAAYDLFPRLQDERKKLHELIDAFKKAAGKLQGQFEVLPVETPIGAVVVPGNEAVIAAAADLQQRGFDVRPIRYPTVPRGSERLRIVLHSFNTVEQVEQLVEIFPTFNRSSTPN